MSTDAMRRVRRVCVRRARFLLESVQDTKERLQGVGSDLLVAVGKPEEVIPGEPHTHAQGQRGQGSPRIPPPPLPAACEHTRPWHRRQYRLRSFPHAAAGSSISPPLRGRRCNPRASLCRRLSCAALRTGRVPAALLEGAGPEPVVYTQEEVTSEELAVDARVTRAIKAGHACGGSGVCWAEEGGMACRERHAPARSPPLGYYDASLPQGSGGKLTRVWGSTLYHLDDLPFTRLERDMSDVFTPFKEKVERNSQVRDEQGSWRRWSHAAPPRSSHLPALRTLDSCHAPTPPGDSGAILKPCTEGSGSASPTMAFLNLDELSCPSVRVRAARRRRCDRTSRHPSLEICLYPPRSGRRSNSH